jgi:hypothetical protein
MGFRRVTRCVAWLPAADTEYCAQSVTTFSIRPPTYCPRFSFPDRLCAE